MRRVCTLLQHHGTVGRKQADLGRLLRLRRPHRLHFRTPTARAASDLSPPFLLSLRSPLQRVFSLSLSTSPRICHTWTLHSCGGHRQERPSLCLIMNLYRNLGGCVELPARVPTVLMVLTQKQPTLMDLLRRSSISVITLDVQRFMGKHHIYVHICVGTLVNGPLSATGCSVGNVSLVQTSCRDT